MPKLTINGKEVSFEQGMTVLQVCDAAEIEVPRFCYHDRLKIAGNCRMCLVEIEGGPPKPVASCAMPAGDKMVVHTNSSMVKKAREGVLEFQLINHPLDCPICDQGGECDLQDQAMAYGRGESRFKEKKHAVAEKNYGPLIKTHMTRCIHCTRCIRFMNEIAGVEVIGGIGRGEDMEIGTFIQKNINSELSGNIIDLCPVGALTSKPYAFRARSWELRKIESIDVMDAVGSNIRIDTRGNEVMRILPRLNEDVNEEWISDKTRFACDGLKRQRLDKPMLRKNGKLIPVTWKEAFATITAKLRGVNGQRVAAIAGDMADAETMFLLKKLMNNIGSGNIDCRTDGAKLDNSNRSSYLFNATIAGIEDADACLLIGTNPRYEAPLINARLRKRNLKGNFQIASIGPEADLTYKVNNLGNSTKILEEIASGENTFSKVLEAASNPIIIIGAGAYTRKDGAAIMAIASKIAEKYGLVQGGKDGFSGGFNILHTAASRVAGLDLGFVPDKGGKDVAGILKAVEKGDMDIVYLLGVDDIDMSALAGAFVIYQGHHGDAGAHCADVILPGSAYTEKDATYVNTEGRVQRTRRAVFPPGEAKEDWRIIKELSDILGFDMPYERLRQVRDEMVQYAGHFAAVDKVIPALWKSKYDKEGKLNSELFTETIDNFYMTDPISRASETMAKCTAEFWNNGGNKNAA